MRRRAILAFTAAAALLRLAGPAAAADTERLLIGRWVVRTRDGREVLQFFSSGTATATESSHPDRTTTWSYLVLDEHHLRMENQGLLREAKVLDIEVDADTLTLREGATVIARYRRHPQ